MIVFKNKGVIDLRAIKTFGVSVKKENAIGFFGTGLKYAIAILLREGCKITVYAGGVENRFTTKIIEVTGQEFEIVCMNDEELGFTTEVGKTWKLWQAMREIYCNCTDEGGTIEKTNTFSCPTDETVIVIESPDFERIYDDISLYILQGPADIENNKLAIRRFRTDAVFYKGVRVKDDQGACMFTYDIKDKIELTEDRTAKYSHDVYREIASGVMLLECEETIERIITAPELTFEGQLNYNYSSQKPGPQFLSVAKRLSESKTSKFNVYAIEYAKKHIEVNDDPTEYVPTALEMKQLQRAQELLMMAGYPINTYPIHVVERLGMGVLAQAKMGKMLISRACFSKGTKLIAHALLEEHFHLDTGHQDETRAFQTFLFDNILTLIERLNQEAF